MPTNFYGPATPVDTESNPDIDSAMGYNAQPGDDATTQFTKGLQSSLFRNSDDGRKLTVELAKQKLANQLEMQLEQRKLELKKQYPDYQFHQMPWGAIAVENPNTGDVKMSNATGDTNDPNSLAGATYKRYMAEAAAATAKANEQSDPAIIEANRAVALLGPEKDQAQIDEAKAMAALRPAMAQRNLAMAENYGKPKPHIFTPADEEKINQIAFQNIMGTPMTGPTAFMASRKLQSSPELQQKLQAEKDRLRAQWSNDQPQGGGLAAPAQGSPPPDLSGLTNFGPSDIQ